MKENRLCVSCFRMRGLLRESCFYPDGTTVIRNGVSSSARSECGDSLWRSCLSAVLLSAGRLIRPHRSSSGLLFDVKLT